MSNQPIDLATSTMNTLTLYWFAREPLVRRILAEGCFPDPCPPPDEDSVCLAAERHLHTFVDCRLIKTDPVQLKVLRVEIWLPEELQVEDRFVEKWSGVMPSGFYIFPIAVLNGLIKSMGEVPRDWLQEPARRERWMQELQDDEALKATLGLGLHDPESIPAEDIEYLGIGLDTKPMMHCMVCGTRVVEAGPDLALHSLHVWPPLNLAPGVWRVPHSPHSLYVIVAAPESVAGTHGKTLGTFTCAGCAKEFQSSLVEVIAMLVVRVEQWRSPNRKN